MGKDKKLKIPKKIAGVKVLKKLRRKAKEAIRIAENPATRELALAALSAAAAALVQNQEVRRRTREAGATARTAASEAVQEARAAGEKARGRARAAAEATREEAGEAAETVHRETLRLGDVIRAAALEGARRLLEEMETARQRAVEAAGDGDAVKRGGGRRRKSNGGEEADRAD